MVRGALDALADRARHWTYISSCSVYAVDNRPGQDETAPRHPPLTEDEADAEDYGPAKVRCEDLVVEAMGERSLLARAGLIAGPGDPSDRFGYWVSRFAIAGEGPVLVPDAPGLLTQTVDVRDLAAWIVHACHAGTRGAVNAVGERLVLRDVLDQAAAVAGFRGSMVRAEPTWLSQHDVQPWAGPHSLPLWLPLPEYAGFGSRDDGRATRSGLVRRSLDDMLAGVLADERARGLDRHRRAGLTRAEELALIGIRRMS
jgi:nucleoside-diphosphate-sugar epimerase